MKKLWGFAGMGLIQFCYFPQLFKVLKTHEVAGLAWEMYACLMVGLLFYLVYAIKIRDIVYIISNTFNLFSAGLLLYLILLWG